MPARDDKHRRRPGTRTPARPREKPVMRGLGLPDLGFGRQRRCPTCLVEITPDEVRVEDINGQITVGQLPARRLFGRLQRRQAGDAGVRVARYLCPRGHFLPRQLLDIGVYPIALLGLSQSMKTHYVAATTHQLVYEAALKRPDPRGVLTFEVLDECNQRLRSEFIAPLFERHVELVPTEKIADPHREPVRDPITLQAEYIAERGVVGSRRTSAYISLYDAPGEVFRAMKDQLLHAPYLAAPAGVLLFIDAASIPEVRGLLDGSAPQNFNSVDPHIVSAAGRIMREFDDHSRVDVPVAVVVSRADLLLRSAAFAEFHPFLGRESLLDEAAMFQARQFVSRYADGFSTATAMAFGGERVRYFFASATGESPVDGRFGAVRPWGCLGPLLWLLKQTGFAA